MSSLFGHTRIKTRHLLLIAQLDRDRSVLRAADAVGMSQPAASKLLREIEDVFGVPLFERHARGVVPTAYGETVLRHARSILASLDRAQIEVEALRRGEHYSVSIGTVLSPGTELLPTALSLLAARHPTMEVRISTDASRPLIAQLLGGRLDIVIGRIRDVGDAAALEFEAIADEPHSVFVRRGHPLAQRRRVRIQDLVDQTWVMPPADSLLRERINAMFLQHGLALPARIVETTSVPVINNLLRRCDMLVALPEEVVRPYCDSGMLQVLPIDTRIRMDAFGLVTRRGHRLSPHADEALDALRDAARDIYGRKPRVVR